MRSGPLFEGRRQTTAYEKGPRAELTTEAEM